MTGALPVIADVDTGVDDALALLFLAAHPDIDLLGVTAVAGNVAVDVAARNSLDVLTLAGAGDIPVARGASRPLINEAHDATAVHGSNGLGGIELPRSPNEPVGTAAPVFIKELIDQSPEPLTVLGLGPLTNIALFLRTYPEQARRLGRIVFMGGSAGVGNASAVTEFNAWHDPEAVSIVINSGVPVIMYGLDVFYRPAVQPAQIAELVRSTDAVRRFAGSLLDFAAQGDADDPRLPVGATLGDAGAAYAITDPAAITVHDLPVQIALSGLTRGQTVVDRRGFVGESERHGFDVSAPVIGVTVDLDADRVVAGYLDRIGERARGRTA